MVSGGDTMSDDALAADAMEEITEEMMDEARERLRAIGGGDILTDIHDASAELVRLRGIVDRLRGLERVGVWEWHDGGGYRRIDNDARQDGAFIWASDLDAILKEAEGQPSNKGGAS